MPNIVGTGSAELTDVDNVGAGFGILRLCWPVAELLNTSGFAAAILNFPVTDH